MNARPPSRGIGALVILGAVFGLLAAIGLMSRSPIGAVSQLMLCGLTGVCGLGLRSLLPWGRTIDSAMVGVSLAAATIATLVSPAAQQSLPGLVIMGMFSALFLWLLWNDKARVVFTAHYREVVVRATPHIEHKTSKVLIAVLVLLVVAVVLALVLD